jgi:hypothetical protein
MPAGRSVPREKATAQLVALLERICSADGYVRCITEVRVFGSYARGALTVGDVDLNIEYDAKVDPDLDREMFDRLVSGRDWNTPLRQALKPGRLLQVMYGRAELLDNSVMLYRRGDTLDIALARVRAIEPDPDAGRADRDPVHPTLVRFVDDLARPSRILLTELARRDIITLTTVDLPDSDLDAIANPDYRDAVRFRWSDRSPLRRAALAAGVWLQDRGADLSRVHLLGNDVDRGKPDTPWAVECREGKLSSLVQHMRHPDVGDALYAIRPDRKRPLRALHIQAADPGALAGIGDIDFWLSQNAPHIHRIG